MEAEAPVSEQEVEKAISETDDMEVNENATAEAEEIQEQQDSEVQESPESSEILDFEPTYSLEDLNEIRKWWEIPCVAHFCSLFRAAFDLPDFDIEELEEALLASGTPEGSMLMCDLISQLLNGCYGRNDIKSYNFEVYLKDIFKQRLEVELGENNPLDDSTFQMLPVRRKLDLLQAICDYRLDADDVQDLLKGLDGDNLRVESMGKDGQGALYWYFYGVRLYKEDPEPKPDEGKKTRASKKATPKKIKKTPERKTKTPRRGRRQRKSRRQQGGTPRVVPDPPSTGKKSRGRSAKKSRVTDESMVEEELKADEMVVKEEATPQTDVTMEEQTAAGETKEEGMDVDGAKPSTETTSTNDTIEQNGGETEKPVASQDGKADVEEVKEEEAPPADDTPSSRRSSRRISKRAKELAEVAAAVALADEEESDDDDSTIVDEDEEEEEEEEEAVTESDDDDDNVPLSVLQKDPVPPQRWHLICQTFEDWQQLAESFKDSTVRCERSLCRTINEDFLPEIPRIMEEKERDMKRRALENAPRRSSCRLEEKQKQREEEEKLLEIQLAHEEKLKQEEEEERRRILELEKLEIQKRQRAEREKQRERMKEERERAVKKRAQRAAQREEKVRLIAERERMLSEGLELPSELKNLDANGHRDDDDDEDRMDNALEELYSGMRKILFHIKAHDDSWPFWEPVKEEFAPEYFKIIKEPMDLMTIERKLDDREYKALTEFAYDFQLLFDNCERYNGDTSDFTYMARTLEKIVHLRMKKLMPKTVSRYDVDDDFVPEFDPSTVRSRPRRETSAIALENMHNLMRDQEEEDDEEDEEEGKDKFTIIYPALKSRGGDMRTAEGQARFLQALQAAKRKEAAEEFLRKGDTSQRSLMVQTNTVTIPKDPPRPADVNDPVKGIIIQKSRNKVQLLGKTVTVQPNWRYNGQPQKPTVPSVVDDPELAALPMHQRIKEREARKAKNNLREPKAEPMSDCVSVVRRSDVSRNYSELIQKTAKHSTPNHKYVQPSATPKISPKVVHISLEDFKRLQSQKAKVIVVPNKDSSGSGTVIHLSTGGIRTEPSMAINLEYLKASAAKGIVSVKNVNVLEHSSEKFTVLKTTPVPASEDGGKTGEDIADDEMPVLTPEEPLTPRGTKAVALPGPYEHAEEAPLQDEEMPMEPTEEKEPDVGTSPDQVEKPESESPVKAATQLKTAAQKTAAQLKYATQLKTVAQLKSAAQLKTAAQLKHKMSSPQQGTKSAVEIVTDVLRKHPAAKLLKVGDVNYRDLIESKTKRRNSKGSPHKAMQIENTPKTIMKTPKKNAVQTEEEDMESTPTDTDPDSAAPVKKKRKSVSWSQNLTTESSSAASTPKETRPTPVQRADTPRTTRTLLYKDGVHSRRRIPAKASEPEEEEEEAGADAINGMVSALASTPIIKTYSKKQPELKRSYESDFFLDTAPPKKDKRDPSPPKLTRIAQESPAAPCDRSAEAPPDIVSDPDNDSTQTSDSEMNTTIDVIKPMPFMKTSSPLYTYSGGKRKRKAASTPPAAAAGDDDGEYMCAKVVRRTKRSPIAEKYIREAVLAAQVDKHTLEDVREPRGRGRPPSSLKLPYSLVTSPKKSVNTTRRSTRSKKVVEEIQEPVMDLVSESNFEELEVEEEEEVEKEKSFAEATDKEVGKESPAPEIEVDKVSQAAGSQRDAATETSDDAEAEKLSTVDESEASIAEEAEEKEEDEGREAADQSSADEEIIYDADGGMWVKEAFVDAETDMDEVAACEQETATGDAQESAEADNEQTAAEGGLEAQTEAEQVQAKEITTQVEAEDIAEQVESEESAKQVQAEEIATQVNAEDIPVQAEAEDIAEQVEAEKVVVEQVHVEEISTQVEAEDIAVQVEAVESAEQVEAEEIAQQIVAEEIVQQVEAEEMVDQTIAEDSAVQVEAEDIVDQVVAEEVDEEIEAEGILEEQIVAEAAETCVTYTVEEPAVASVTAAEEQSVDESTAETPSDKQVVKAHSAVAEDASSVEVVNEEPSVEAVIEEPSVDEEPMTPEAMVEDESETVDEQAAEEPMEEEPSDERGLVKSPIPEEIAKESPVHVQQAEESPVAEEVAEESPVQQAEESPVAEEIAEEASDEHVIVKSPVAELETKETSVVELEAEEPSVVELEAEEPSVVELEAEEPSVVEAICEEPSHIEHDSVKSHVAEQEVENPSETVVVEIEESPVVEQGTEAMVEEPCVTEQAIDKPSVYEAVAEETSDNDNYTVKSSIAEQEPEEPSVIEQVTEETSVVPEAVAKDPAGDDEPSAVTLSVVHITEPPVPQQEPHETSVAEEMVVDVEESVNKDATNVEAIAEEPENDTVKSSVEKQIPVVSSVPEAVVVEAEESSVPEAVTEMPVVELHAEMPVNAETVTQEKVVVEQHTELAASSEHSEEPSVHGQYTEELVVAEEVTEEPVVVEQISEEPLVVEQREEPSVHEQYTTEPVVDEDITEEPVVAEQVSEEPVVVDEVTEEPVVAEQVSEEPVVAEQYEKTVVVEKHEEPSVHEQNTTEPVVDEEVTEEAVVVEQVSEEPSVHDQYTAESVVAEQLAEEESVTKMVVEESQISEMDTDQVTRGEKEQAAEGSAEGSAEAMDLSAGAGPQEVEAEAYTSGISDQSAGLPTVEGGVVGVTAVACGVVGELYSDVSDSEDRAETAVSDSEDRAETGDGEDRAETAVSDSEDRAETAVGDGEDRAETAVSDGEDRAETAGSAEVGAGDADTGDADTGLKSGQEVAEHEKVMESSGDKGSETESVLQITEDPDAEKAAEVESVSETCVEDQTECSETVEERHVSQNVEDVPASESQRGVVVKDVVQESVEECVEESIDEHDHVSQNVEVIPEHKSKEIIVEKDAVQESVKERHVSQSREEVLLPSENKEKIVVQDAVQETVEEGLHVSQRLEEVLPPNESKQEVVVETVVQDDGDIEMAMEETEVVEESEQAVICDTLVPSSNLHCDDQKTSCDEADMEVNDCNDEVSVVSQNVVCCDSEVVVVVRQNVVTDHQATETSVQTDSESVPMETDADMETANTMDQEIGGQFIDCWVSGRVCTGSGGEKDTAVSSDSHQREVKLTETTDSVMERISPCEQESGGSKSDSVASVNGTDSDQSALNFEQTSRVLVQTSTDDSHEFKSPSSSDSTYKSVSRKSVLSEQTVCEAQIQDSDVPGHSSSHETVLAKSPSHSPPSKSSVDRNVFIEFSSSVSKASSSTSPTKGGAATPNLPQGFAASLTSKLKDFKIPVRSKTPENEPTEDNS